MNTVNNRDPFKDKHQPKFCNYNENQSLKMNWKKKIYDDSK